MKQSYTLHDMPREERPRERLRRVGVDNLSVQELLALVIERAGKPGQSVMTTAQDLLSHFGGVKNIREASLVELEEVDGIGPATATKLKAVFKLGDKSKVECDRYGQKIERPEDVFNVLRNRIGNKKKEHFVTLSLDSQNRLIDINEVSVGTLNTSLVHPREVFNPAIRYSASKVLVAHNHPRGKPIPSENDIQVTQDLLEASKVLNIELIDHVIITKDKFLSIISHE